MRGTTTRAVEVERSESIANEAAEGARAADAEAAKRTAAEALHDEKSRREKTTAGQQFEVRNHEKRPRFRA
jgi:hypothetical protein